MWRCSGVPAALTLSFAPTMCPLQRPRLFSSGGCRHPASVLWSL
ncbi:unnamed protein product [Staurois parvus]|uniref:Uncharacterized protein n=1 Tax=Staurois parvus TaxID=386267 RepID=A0ABN9D715_9NEOB|nr:unnamed protein product [Staurois parvus]